MIFYIFGFHTDQPVLSLQSSDVPSHPTVAGDKDNIRQRQQSPPETQMNQSFLKVTWMHHLLNHLLKLILISHSLKLI